ncbi:MAG TPA: anti-sigma factor [Gaiellaceae bacterium]
MWLRRGREEEADAGGVAELASLADGSLPAERRAELEAEVAASPLLADRLAEQERAVALLRGAEDEVDAPAGLRARVEAQRPARTARAPRRLALGGVAVAAVAAAAIAVAVVSSGSHGARFQAALGPTALAPEAKGDATLTKTSSGWRIHLDAVGLPRLANGRFYEAWLRSSAGTLVPIGTFNEGRDVTLWAGVSPANFTALTVTRERADGNQASSGEKVLAGPVRTG